MAGVILLILIIVVAGGKNNKDGEISRHVVDVGDVSNNLILSGEVEPVEEVEMSFAQSGMVDRVYKKVGDNVYRGEKIIELDNASLRADLADALASLDLIRAQSEVSNAELDQDVKNAYSRLFSDDLIPYSKNPDLTNAAPTVSGSYTKGVEGEYRIEVERSNYGSGFIFKYSGLEIGEEVIFFYKAVPLGSSGLYLKFEEGETTSGNVWRLAIPNIEGDSYVQNLNAYESALASRDAAEEKNISKDIANAKIKQAEAQVAKIRAQIAERTLSATFNGVVGNISVKEGEIASAGSIVAKILSEGAYHVVVQVPEVDVVNMEAGLSAGINLDAYGSDVIFKGEVLSVDQSETEVDGVSVYEARIGFTEADPRIRSGMTADVSILKETKVGVVRIPRRFLDKDETGDFVLVEKDESQEKTHVVVGLEGSDGLLEVKEGLVSGDVVVGVFEE